jgi:excisionase family DNA binding protein
MKDFRLDTLKRGGSGYDPRIRAYRWVEGFFVQHPHLSTSRSLWLDGTPPAELLEAWERWYEQHPLQRVIADDEVRTISLEFAPITIAEAAEYTKRLQPSISRAIKEGRLTAWRPKGMGWYTNRYWLDEWVKAYPGGRPRKRWK